MRRTFFAAAILLGSLVPLSTGAEVKATHPDEAADGKQHLPSPMVLELPLPTADPARQNKGEQRPPDLQSLKEYVCDGVMIHDASIGGQKLRSGELRSNLKLMFYTEPGVDKLLNVRTEILSDGKMVSLGLAPGIDAEEGKYSYASFSMTVPNAYLAPEKSPTLRIILTVVPNP